jgi:cell division initiation protein
MPLPLPNKGNESPGWAPTEEQGTSLSSRLPRSRRGYDTAATDALLAELASKQATLEQECNRLRQEAAELEAELARHREQEHLVGKTMLAATSHAMTVREEARKEAELTLRKAQAERERRTALAGQIERDRADAERELLRLRRLANEMQSGLASFLTQTLEQLQPEAEARSAESPPAGGVQEVLAGALEAALEQKGDEPRPWGGDVTSPRAGA